MMTTMNILQIAPLRRGVPASMACLLGMPMLVVNMGCEMLYILDQRLRAQKIAGEKSQKVLQDVVRHMFDKDFVGELFQPQELYTVKSTRQVFDRLAHSSIMRLSTSSMDKLYDLMTMGFKYQLLACMQSEALMDVTMLHLSTVLGMVREPSVAAMVQYCVAKVQTVYGGMVGHEYRLLRQTLCMFMQDKRVKVSLFLQDSIQTPDGAIVIQCHDAMAQHAEGEIEEAVVGAVRYFGAGGEVSSEEVIELPIAADFARKDPNPSPGTNLYSKKRDPKAKQAALDAAKEAAAEEAARLTERAEERKAGGPKLTATNSVRGTGGEELSLLASLAGGAAASENDKGALSINLFGNYDDVFTTMSSSTTVQSQMMTIDAGKTGASSAHLSHVMGSLDDSSGGAAEEIDEEEDDLLDLMDGL